MTNNEAQELVALCCRLWDKWEPNKIQLAEAREFFRRFPSAGRAQKAVENYRFAGGQRWAKPQFEGIKLEASKLSAGTMQENTVKRSGWFIQCFAEPGPVGCFHELLFVMVMPVEQHVRDIARVWAEQHSQLYGGEWRVWEGAELHQLQERAIELRNSGPRRYTKGGPLAATFFEAIRVMKETREKQNG